MNWGNYKRERRFMDLGDREKTFRCLNNEARVMSMGESESSICPSTPPRSNLNAATRPTKARCHPSLPGGFCHHFATA
jgi:hypothetical protein